MILLLSHSLFPSGPTKKLRGAAAFSRVPLERVVGPSIDASIKYGQNLVKHVI
jgi:hypothetical protein